MACNQQHTGDRNPHRQQPCSPMACGTLRALLARGRPRVRCTLLSKSRSHRSFTVQPAPRSRMAPAPNRASILKSGRLPGGAARAMLQKQGHARSQVPAEETPQITSS